MSKVKKATKKFAQKKAKGTAQFKRKPQHKKHGHKLAANGTAKGSAKVPAAADDDEQQQEQHAAAKRVEEMDLDEFLDGGFEAAAEAGGDSGSEDDVLSEDEDSADLDDVISDEDDITAAGQGKAGTDDDADDADVARSSEEDDSEDGEGEEGDAEAAAVAADNAKLKGAVSKHKQQLEALKAKDPEFYAYLEASDKDLLGFGENEDDSDIDEEDEDSDEDEQPAAAKGKKEKAVPKQDKPKASQAAAAEAVDDDEDAAVEGSEEEAEDADEGGKQTLQVTSSLVEGWTQAALEKASLGAMMQLVKAYRVACHYGDTEQEMSSTLSITSGAVFNKVLLFMLKEADGIFRRMLGLNPDSTTAAGAEGSGGKANVLMAEQVTKAQRWRKVEPLMKSYLGNSIHLLSSMTQPAMTAFTLRRLRASAAFLGPFNHLSKKLMRMGLKLFGSEEAAPRLQALLLVRQMALVLPAPACQSVLRGAYRSYVSSAKFVSPASLPTLNFMAAGFVELSSLDLAVTYQVGFVAIRELAVLLRNALAAKTQDAHKEVYCWQTLMCLELWVKVLAAAAPQGTLQPLVYPTTQLLLGAARLVPTPRYFPIRLRLVRAINKLAQATSVYIPVSPLLLEMVQWSELRKSPTGTAAAPDLLMLLRLSKTQLKTAATQEEVVSQVLELLTEHLAQWATSISYPELSHLPCVVLRGFIKGCAVERFRRQAKTLVDALERNAAYVGNARDNVSFAPQDLAAAANFLSSDKERAQAPLAQYARQLLQKAAARLAMRSSNTQEMRLGSGPGGKRKRGRDGDSDEDDAAGSSDVEGANGLLPADESDEDDEQLDAAAKRMMRQKEKRLKRSAAAGADTAAADGADSDADSDEGGEAGVDQVGVYQLSDEEDSEEGEGFRGWGAGFDGGDSGGEDSDSEEEGAAAARGQKGRGGGRGGGRGDQQRARGGGGRGPRGGRGGQHGQRRQHGQQQLQQGGRGGGGSRGGGRGGGGGRGHRGGRGRGRGRH